ncbi:MFS transporter [Segetibacter koreensis]|uniref:MFS transporter n=1 Tax=Segetibacter koreensis TaxID=398037 RepID=UPI00035F0B97|nr:MFS transporter [Segetibacter koreensis]
MPAILHLYKKAYKGLTKETWYLSLVILINRSGTMVIPFMTMYATQKLGFSIAQAGFIMSFFGVGSIIGAFLGGKITDAIGFHKVQLFALLGGGIMFITVGYLSTYLSLCIGILLLSVVNESFRPANAAAVAAYSKPENRTRSYSLNRLAINLGWAFGGTLGGFLAARNYHALFWVDGLTNISAAILLMFVLKKANKEKAIILKIKEENVSTAPSAYKDRQYLVFIALTILFAFCFFQMFTLLPVFYKTQLGISEDEIGMLMAVNGLIIAFVEMFLVYNLERKSKPLKFISYGVWLVAISYVLFNLLQGQFMLALISILIITVGEMLSMPFMNTYWISRSSESNRGQYAALYSMSWATSQIAAPSIGGWIAEKYSFNALFWVLFVTAGLSALGYSFLMTRVIIK